MLFNTINFAIFLPIVFIIYWLLSKKELIFQNLVLLISSYFFYSCWDWRFLFLLIFSTFLDYFSGIRIENSNSTKKKKIWLWISIVINLGFLGVFKYFNFFADSFKEAFSLLGIEVNSWTLSVILPVGISFYTFHGLSYVIDIYYNRIKAEKSLIDYSVFVSFFPLLVAGPIERATHLLPQIKRERVFDYDNAICGLRQILWGLVKKVVIADQLSEYANEIFDNYSQYNGSALIIGAIYFAFQIYCDFSGYSDIALGTAKLFGIELLRNFAFPYFSRDIAEFWRRWHISLSSWFRDYLYFPMGGSRVGIKRRILNTFVIFLVSGFWHGANWTFIFWGGLNAIYFLPLLLSNNNRNNLDIVASGRLLPSFREFIQVMLTFFLTVIAWVFFRSVNLTSAFNYLHGMFNISLFAFPNIAGIGGLFKSALLLVFFILIEWFGRESSFGIEHFGLKWKKGFRWVFYYLLIGLVIFYSAEEQQFIYFQF